MTEPLSWDQLAAELGFLDIVREESKRTIYCELHRVHQIRAAVDQAGASGILTVRANSACPPGQLLIIDENAMAAAQEEFIQGLGRKPWRFGGTS